MSSGPAPDIERWDFPLKDKLAHMVLFGGLAAVVSIGLRHNEPPPRLGRQFWVPLLFATLYGVSDEVHQYFVPSRTFAVSDMVANALGALLVQWGLCSGLWRLPARSPAGESA